MLKTNIVIIGAGMSGIMAGQTLKKRGQTDFLIIDKGRSVGGRMATRRIDAGKADHGAQFFTARTRRFQSEVNQWLSEGSVVRWFGKNHPRYMSIDGMNKLAKRLASDLPVMLNIEVTSIQLTETGYLLTTMEGDIQAEQLIVTVPAPQAEALLVNGNVPINQEDLNTLHQIKFSPCLVGIFKLSRPSKLPTLGHLDQNLPEGIIRMVDHYDKGISHEHILSVYMTGEWSQQHFNEEPHVVLAEIVKKSNHYFVDQAIEVSQLKKWRYAEAVKFLRQPYLSLSLPHPLVLAGDAFLTADDSGKHTRLETAFTSGVLTAEYLIDTMM